MRDDVRYPSPVMPDLIGHPDLNRCRWIPHQVRDDAHHPSTVMPDLIGHPDPTVVGGPPIKSGVTRGRSRG